MLELHKIIARPIIVHRDEDGKAVGEESGPEVSIFNSDQLVQFMAALENELAQFNAQQEQVKEDGGD